MAAIWRERLADAVVLAPNNMILIDPRAGSHQYLAKIKGKVNCKVEHSSLPSGDFAFDGNGPNGRIGIGIELKRLDDMLGSMRQGRLAGDQLVNMNGGYGMTYVILQGRYRPDEEGNLTVLRKTRDGMKWVVLDISRGNAAMGRMFKYAELDKHICTLECLKHVCMVRAETSLEVTWQVVNRYLWWQKAWEEHNSGDPIKLQAEVMFNRVSLRRDIATRIPAIGWKRSKDVAVHFKTTYDMVTASAEEWQEVEGIGGKIAKDVWSKLRSE